MQVGGPRKRRMTLGPEGEHIGEGLVVRVVEGGVRSVETGEEVGGERGEGVVRRSQRVKFDPRRDQVRSW